MFIHINHEVTQLPTNHNGVSSMKLNESTSHQTNGVTK